MGAAYLAGFFSNFYPDPEYFSATWMLDKRFNPEMDQDTREQKYAGWKHSVRQVLNAKVKT
jgi:glycerol kinase